MPPSVRPQVEALRHKLLDLSLRNRMLNFRPSRRLGLVVVGEDSAEIHRLLVEEGRKLTFDGRPDPPAGPAAELFAPDYEDVVSQAEFREAAREELEAFLGTPAPTASPRDTRLATEEFESDLQTKLRQIQREANLSREELGVDTLFLTLGMLEWRDPAAGEGRTHQAPLLFVPVVLDRQANGSLRLRHAGADVGQNEPLRAKLRELNLALPDLGEDTDLPAFFAAVRAAVRGRSGWQVWPDRIALGFFNYEKFAMYADLGGDAWPEARKPWLHPDVVALLGEGYPPPETDIGDDTPLDPLRPAETALEVFDADASQTLALLRAAAGLSLVVEGPPGTGKSQTITNMIAEAVAAGRTVLFVSAKRAALGVVQRNLERAGLGDICLDLHDKMTNRRDFYAELKRTAALARRAPGDAARVARWGELRERLNAHAAAVNEPLPAFGCTPFAAMVRLAELGPEAPEDREGRVDFAALRGWPEAELERRLPLVEALQARLGTVGVPREHAFWGSRLTYLDPALRLDLQEDLAAAAAALAAAEARLAEAAAALRVPPPAAFAGAPLLRVWLQRALSAPPLEGVAVADSVWPAAAPRLREALAALTRVRETTARRAAQVLPAAWEADWSTALAEYEAHVGQWYGFLYGRFRAARGALRAALRAPLAGGEAELGLLRDLEQVRADRALLRAAAAECHRFFGTRWQGEAVDPAPLLEALEWLVAFHGDVAARRLPAGLVDLVAAGPPPPTAGDAVAAAEAAAAAALAAFRKVAAHLQMDEPAAETPTAEARDQVARWTAALPGLPAYIAYAGAREQALAEGLAAVVAVAERWGPGATRLRVVVLRSYYEGVLREARAERPALRGFDREEHERLVAEFGALDDFKLAHNRARVRAAHSSRLPSFAAATGNLQLLRQQCELTRRHRPIRWAMARAGKAVMHLKPVFLMSPLSVAIHLPPEMPPFHLVIFDEASQVKPEDSLCAIARGQQTIVVGDTRQMPPTSFFDRVAEDADLDEEADEEAAELARGAREQESILSLMSAVAVGRARRPDLRWHYRSLHPALIQPSNEMFYENRLVVFPSAAAEADGRRIGVVFHLIPDGLYEAGRSRRVNRPEAEAVADAVVRHLRERPEESLLVAAMNRPQADLIWDLLDQRERADPALFASFRERHPHEPLDARNLENVQGDERDVVFLSVTYGRDGAGVVHQRFGPLLTDGGERRLNVLITRARRRCEVFSSLRAADVRPDAARRGVVCLQRYLRYAETGVLDHTEPTGRPPESPFEDAVAAALRSHGYEVDPQVGSAGYRLDLAVRSPVEPGRYLLGVECDGASYHSARSARDRDKLRQRVLEQRGWRLHRIWSTDWWQDPAGEIERLLGAVRAAENGEMLPAEPPPPPSAVEPVAEAPEPVRETPTRPYEVAPPPTPGEWLEDYCLRVVATEGPIQDELLLTRLRIAKGWSRLGTQVRAQLEGEVDRLRRAGRLMRVRDAWCIHTEQLVVPRDWSARPAAEKKPEFVSEPEYAAALLGVIRHAYGIAPDDAVREAIALLGFRATGPARDRAAAVLATLRDSGEVVETDGLLRLRT